MIETEVLIVGGGPAGSSLGFQLQKAGIKTCIIDKAVFPRKKLCGGLLTEKTVDTIGEIYGVVDFPCELVTSKVAMYLGTERISGVDSSAKFYLVERTNFDNYFIEQYKNCGGTLIEGADIQSVDVPGNKVFLANGTGISYEILVGADGANSEIRKQVDAHYRPNAICVEFDYLSDHVTDEIQVYFSAVRSGYGWCFPKKGRYTVGIGGSKGDYKHLSIAFAKFSESINKPDTDKRRTGATIPYGKFVKTPAKGRILLIGDAAGLVDPITGEGIYFAFCSARCACEAIIALKNGKRSLAEAYQSNIAWIQNIIREANFFNKVFMNDLLKTICLNLIRGKTNVIQYFCDNLLSHYHVTYFGFVSKYLKVRRLRKRRERQAQRETADKK